jgi:hypothetical protein
MFSSLHQALTSKAVSLQYYCEGLVIPKTNYRGHVRKASQLSNMPTNVQDLPTKEINALNKNTGFPEPLSPGMPRLQQGMQRLTFTDRNTTLPHPDADTSPNASIEAPDVDLARTHSRNSFLHRRHHSKNSFGKLDMKDSGLYDNIQYADGTRETANTRALDANSSTRGNSVDPPSQANGDILGDVQNRDEQGYTDGERKKGVLRKLQLHKV